MAVSEALKDCDVLIMAAAVADYTPVSCAESKIKKQDGDMSLELKRTMDILKYAGENKKEPQVICGFSMETEDLIENSQRKLISKNCDLIAANSLRESGAGFGVDTNRITLITAGGVRPLDLMSKETAAHELLDEIMRIREIKLKKA